MNAELWRPVPGFENRYEVSDLGRIRSLRPWNGRPPGRVRTPFKNPHGYLSVTLMVDEVQRRTRLVHQLVLAAFVGPRPGGMQTRHLDGNKTNNALINLRYGTHSENQLDNVRLGVHHNSRKTCCKHGHPFTPENTLIRREGHRDCRTCMRARKAKFLAARAAA